MNPGIIFSVSDLNRYIKGLLDSEEALRDIWVRAEISNFRHHTSGHMYFTLKDESASLSGVMFRSQAMKVKFRPENGMGVLVRGYVSVYERAGQYQLYAQEMEPEGVGALHLAFEQLKRQLEAEGLFDPSRKKPLPTFARNIGVVTSPTGAAFRDIVQVSGRRFPGRNLILAPAQVQGEGASEDIARALRLLDRSGLVEVIIVGRGGGSLEDLWAFNEEAVARAVHQAQTPVISAVGHETDYTIADFAADVRAPTPSAAAELAVPSQAQMLEVLQGYSARLSSGVRRSLHEAQNRLEALAQSHLLRRPSDILREERQALDQAEAKLASLGQQMVTQGQHRFRMAASRLDDLSPLAILNRGYSITLLPDGQVAKMARDVPVGSFIEIILAQGRLKGRVEDSWTDRKEIEDHDG